MPLYFVFEIGGGLFSIGRKSWVSCISAAGGSGIAGITHTGGVDSHPLTASNNVSAKLIVSSLGIGNSLCVFRVDLIAVSNQITTEAQSVIQRISAGCLGVQLVLQFGHIILSGV
nr:hypothetical protein [Pseudomonas sp. S9]